MSQNDTLGKRKADQVDQDTKRKRYEEWMEDDDGGLDGNIANSLVDGGFIAPKPNPDEFPILVNHTKDFASSSGDSTSVTRGDAKAFYPTGDADSLNVFWMDAYEEPRIESYGKGGNGSNRFYLFGKRFDGTVFRSVCLIVENMYHNMWLVPHEEVLEKSNAEEIMEAEVDRIAGHISGRRMAFTEKSYCFELEGIPLKPSKYVNLQIPGAYDPIHLSNNQVFKHAFGANTSFIEQFLIGKRISGPSWITIKNARPYNGSISFCDEEYTVSFKDVSAYTNQKVAASAPFVKALSISCQTMLKDQTNHIVALSGVLHKRVNIDGPTTDEGPEHFTLFTCVFNPFLKSEPRIESKSNATIRYCSTEKELLTSFAQFIRENDPDVFIGHNFLPFHLNAILLRSKAYSLATQDWSCYGRLKRSRFPTLQRSQSFQEKMVVSGRLVADSYLACQEYLREKSNSLAFLTKSQLSRTIYPIENTEDAMHSYFMNNDSIQRLVLTLESHCYASYLLIMKLAILPLTKELSVIAGNLWSKSLSGSRAERIDYLLMHNFHDKNYIIPDKKVKSQFTGKRGKAKYEGGFVMEPKTGLYDKYVLLLDFNSLYPSLILQHNICFTTIDRPRIQSSNIKREDEEKSEPFFASPPSNLNHDISVLPNVLKSLLDRRNQVKRVLEYENDPYKRWLLDIRQKALKLTANSCYGCLGYVHSRFYCEPLAELITRKGRELLQATKDDIERNFGNSVIYGDTDSVMILTQFEDFSEAKQLAQNMRDSLNKGKKYLEIGIDGYFRRILLLKKKKYVAELHTPDRSPLGYSSKKEVKGVEIVRRDWCELSIKTSVFCVDQILSDKSAEEVAEAILNHLQSVGEQVKRESTLKDGVDNYVIYKGLSKLPSEYPDATKQPHVCVAEEMIKQGKEVKPGMRIAFVICNEARDDNYESIGHRAYPMEEFMKRQDLTIDEDYYLGSQIFPPVSRLCQHIEGVSRNDIAQRLGLDVNKYGATHYSNETRESEFFKTWDLFETDDPLKLTCQHCKKEILWHLYSRLKKIHDTNDFGSLFKCDNPDCKMPLSEGRFENAILDNIRRETRRYYSCVLKKQSNNPAVPQSVSLSHGKTIYQGKLKKFEETYSALQLRSFLLHMHRLVDIDQNVKQLIENGVTVNKKILEDCGQIHVLTRMSTLVKTYLESNSCNVINLAQLFR